MTVDFVSSGLHITEFKPHFINRTDISDDLCKVSFEIYKGKNIEIVFNPKRNMFNATNLEQNKVGGDRPSLKDIMKTTKFLRFVDRISFLLFGHYHYQYKGVSIWKNDNTINPELLNDQSHIIKSKLEEVEDDIIETIKTGPNVTRGTWMHYEFLPKILRYIDEDYEILANHYESLLIPYLSNSNVSLNEHVTQFEQSSLLNKAITNYIMQKENPNDKGKESEQEVLKQLKENGFKDAQLTHKKHCCDIILPREKILVEVKAKKRITKDDDRKYIRDLIENQNNIHFGVFVNIEDTNTKSHFALNPLRIYLHPSDFTVPFLNFIKETALSINSLVENDAEAIELLRYIPIIRSIEDLAVDRYYVDFKRVVKALLDRLKLDLEFKEYRHLINTEDVRNKKKTDNESEIVDSLKELDEAINQFVILHYPEFEAGYLIKPCIKTINVHIKSKKLPTPNKGITEQILNRYTYEGRDYSSPGNPHVYFIKPEFKDKIAQQLISDNNINNNNNDTIELPKMNDVLNEFLTNEEVNKRLNENGYEADALAAMFLREIEKYKTEYPSLVTNNYTSEFAKNIYDICVPFQTDNVNYYVYKTSVVGQDIINTFNHTFDEMYKLNKRIGYMNFYKEYMKKCNNKRIIKPVSERMFKELKFNKQK